ncbi:MAG: NAD-dependent succinate-semialdehyde dehydrogenase [Proteobacteria bacterium]|nr:NAD-dependent succinate-semialdehyde dehydrogenase [Pseudomonadota bacterium]
MLKTVNPATGQEIAQYAELSPAQIEEKLALAMQAFTRWRQETVETRTALLEQIANTFEENKDRLARQATMEMGKTYASSVGEVEKCIACFRHFAKAGPAMLRGESYGLSNGNRAEIKFLPLGPVLAIMPWNFPYWQVVRFMAPAILAGNVGLLKHASLVQGTAALIEEMALLAGAPPGLFQNLAIGSKAVAGVIADPRVAAVTLTGSEGAGAAVAEQAGRHLKKLVLELGGSDPFIVMPSADLDKAVKQAVTARVMNTGQSCICGKRMIVHADIYDRFKDAFITAMRAVKAGDPMDKATDMGPLSSAAQRDTVLQQLEDAKQQGAQLHGGEALPGPGAFMNAGVLTDLPPGSAFLQEEVFGPVAMLFRAGDIDEAIRIANDIPYGLGSSVWTEDKAEQAKFIEEIEAGMTAINQVLASSPEAPFGGIKRSGYGRELSHYGLHEFMNLKTVLHAS